MKKLRFSILFLSVSLLSFSSFSKNETGASENNDNIDNSVIIERIDNDDIEVSIPSIIFAFSDVDVKLSFKNPNHTRLLFNKNKITFIINGEEKPLNFINGEVSFKRKYTIKQWTFNKSEYEKDWKNWFNKKIYKQTNELGSR